MSARSIFNRLMRTVARSARSEVGRQARRAVESQFDGWFGDSSDSKGKPHGHGQERNTATKNTHADAPTRSSSGISQERRETGRTLGAVSPGRGYQGRGTGTGRGASVDNHSEAYYLPRGTSLPNFSYTPQQNHRADPGEVVWTWVPFEEDASRGKDRPVLVLAETDRGVIAAQMTSRDRTADFLPHDRYGRAWLDIGTGSWDREGRNSEVRLDRLLMIPRGSMRREGGRLDKATFVEVIAKIREMHE